MTNITETVEEGKPNIITSVQVETAVFADCHLLQEAVDMRLSKPSQSRTPESDRESHGTTKPVGVTLKTKILKPISLGSR